IPILVEIYDLDVHRRLARYVHAERADPTDWPRWSLVATNEKVFADDTIERTAHDTLPWQSFLSARQLEDFVLPASALSPTNLYRYFRYLQSSGQRIERIEFIFWQKVFAPLSVAVMALLAVPFGFGLWRQNVAQRILSGVAVGVVLFLLE